MNISKNNKSLRTLVIESCGFSSEHLKTLLRKNNYNSVCVANNLRTGINMALAYQPDVIYLNLDLLKSAGLRVIPEIRKMLPDVTIVMIAQITDRELCISEMLTSAILFGANGFVFKPFNTSSIVDAMVKAEKKSVLAMAA